MADKCFSISFNCSEKSILIGISGATDEFNCNIKIMAK